MSVDFNGVHQSTYQLWTSIDSSANRPVDLRHHSTGPSRLPTWQLLDVFKIYSSRTKLCFLGSCRLLVTTASLLFHLVSS